MALPTIGMRGEPAGDRASARVIMRVIILSRYAHSRRNSLERGNEKKQTRRSHQVAPEARGILEEFVCAC